MAAAAVALPGAAFALPTLYDPFPNAVLEAMAAGGIHDQVGGGFHRYSTDAYSRLKDNADYIVLEEHPVAARGHIVSDETIFFAAACWYCWLRNSNWVRDTSPLSMVYLPLGKRIRKKVIHRDLARQRTRMQP